MAAPASDCSAQVVLETPETDSRVGESTSAETGPKEVEAELGSGTKKTMIMETSRAEIDTSAPFESVKEAASRFGGIGFWKRALSHKPSEADECKIEPVDVAKVEEQAIRLEKELIVKERETLGVLKELETTKMIVEELKRKLQKEVSKANAASNANLDDSNVNPVVEVSEKESHKNLAGRDQGSTGGLRLCPSSAPGFILMELKQAKLNLTRSTNDLSDIRATVESFNKKIDKERVSLENTREKLSLNCSKISSLEEELNKTRLKLQRAQDAGVSGYSDTPIDIAHELEQLNCEAEQYKQMGAAAKSEVLRALSDIERTTTRIRTAEIRWIAAKKMKQAARATEAVALAEIKALSGSKSSSQVFQGKPSGVILSFEEYTSLTSKARDAEEASKRKVVDAMLQVDEANVSKVEVLKRGREATEEVKTSKKVLEEALNKVEMANRSKLAVEEALRRWRSEHGQKRRSVQKSTKFKNSYPSHHRRESRLLDANGLNLENDDESKPVLRPTLSIGQILSRKLHLTKEYENGTLAEKCAVKRKMSLGQMLSRPNGNTPSMWKAERENGNRQLPAAKRKKFGFARFAVLMRKQSKKKKQQNPNSR